MPISLVLSLVFKYVKPVALVTNWISRLIWGVAAPSGVEYVDFLLYIFSSVFFSGVLARFICDLLAKPLEVGLSKVGLYRFKWLIFLLTGLSVFVAALSLLLALEFPAILGYMSSIIPSFISILISLILAIQLGSLFVNYVAGVLVRVEHLLEEGDFIEFEGEVLRVEKTRFFCVEAVNRFGEQVVIPNVKLIEAPFKKLFSRGKTRFIEVRFTLPYQIPFEEVEKVVRKVVGRRSYKLLVLDLGNYAVVYELQVKPSKPVFPEGFRSDLRKALLREFGSKLSMPLMVTFTDEKIRVEKEAK